MCCSLICLCQESSYCETQFPGRRPEIVMKGRIAHLTATEPHPCKRLDDAEISESPWSFLEGLEPFSKAPRCAMRVQAVYVCSRH